MRLGKGAAGILSLVPFDRAHVGKEFLHRALVSGKELAVQEARIPAEKDAADVEHDDASRAWVCGHGGMRGSARGIGDKVQLRGMIAEEG